MLKKVMRDAARDVMQPCVRGGDWHVVFCRLTQLFLQCRKARERLNLGFCLVFSQLNY